MQTIVYVQLKTQQCIMDFTVKRHNYYNAGGSSAFRI